MKDQEQESERLKEKEGLKERKEGAAEIKIGIRVLILGFFICHLLFSFSRDT